MSVQIDCYDISGTSFSYRTVNFAQEFLLAGLELFGKKEVAKPKVQTYYCQYCRQTLDKAGIQEHIRLLPMHQSGIIMQFIEGSPDPPKSFLSHLKDAANTTSEMAKKAKKEWKKL